MINRSQKIIVVGKILCLKDDFKNIIMSSVKLCNMQTLLQNATFHMIKIFSFSVALIFENLQSFQIISLTSNSSELIKL